MSLNWRGLFRGCFTSTIRTVSRFTGAVATNQAELVDVFGTGAVHGAAATKARARFRARFAYLDNPLPPAIDHNLNVDQPASLRALNAGFKMFYVPCDVTMSAWLAARLSISPRNCGTPPTKPA